MQGLPFAHHGCHWLDDACDGVREQGWGDLAVGLRESEGALDLVLEFTHVPGPAVAEQQVRGIPGDVAARFPLAASVAKQEVLHQQQYVFGTLA